MAERCPHCDEEHGSESCTTCRTYHRYFPRPSYRRPRAHSHAYHANRPHSALKVLRQPAHREMRPRKRYLAEIEGTLQGKVFTASCFLLFSSPINYPPCFILFYLLFVLSLSHLSLPSSVSRLILLPFLPFIIPSHPSEITLLSMPSPATVIHTGEGDNQTSRRARSLSPQRRPTSAPMHRRDTSPPRGHSAAREPEEELSDEEDDAESRSPSRSPSPPASHASAPAAMTRPRPRSYRSVDHMT